MPSAAPVLAAAILSLALAATPALASRPASLPSTTVAWVPAAADADVDQAFAQARRENKPVLLYWGATWCPPCNQLKATLFNRADFSALSRSFVAVHVDGDRPGAQKLGRRFKVSGYPTVVLFSADGQEITRLPGEVEPEQVMAVLQLGLAGGRPVKAVLDDARAGRPLSAPEWRSLAFYSWETDEQQLLPSAELPSTLAQLAVASAASDPETAMRLWLKALAASTEARGVKADDALRERVLALLSNPTRVRQQSDALSGSAAADILRTLAPQPGPARDRLLAAYDAALQRLQADTSLSRADRLGALYGRVQMARLDQPRDAVQVQLPEALRETVRAVSAQLDVEVRDPYERQAVITFAAAVLARAGLWEHSDALLKGNLARSHSPYYLMSQLGGNARRQGRTAEALDWYAQSFDKAEGPATRLQWGAGYLTALVELAPQDAARIEQTAAQLLQEAARDAGAFEGRSLRSLQRLSARLLSWNADGRQAAVLQRLQRQRDTVCARVDTAEGQREACLGLLKSV